MRVWEHVFWCNYTYGEKIVFGILKNAYEDPYVAGVELTFQVAQKSFMRIFDQHLQTRIFHLFSKNTEKNNIGRW